MVSNFESSEGWPSSSFEEELSREEVEGLLLEGVPWTLFPVLRREVFCQSSKELLTDADIRAIFGKEFKEKLLQAARRTKREGCETGFIVFREPGKKEFSTSSVIEGPTAYGGSEFGELLESPSVSLCPKAYEEAAKKYSSQWRGYPVVNLHFHPEEEQSYPSPSSRDLDESEEVWYELYPWAIEIVGLVDRQNMIHLLAYQRNPSQKVTNEYQAATKENLIEIMKKSGLRLVEFSLPLFKKTPDDVLVEPMITFVTQPV